MSVKSIDVDAIAVGVLSGDRATLGRAITLVESRHLDHEARAQELLTQLLPHTGKAHRLGITGVPGVGKSTTIDTLGCNLTADGQKVAVLAVDPTSQRSGGSILGDKTRMTRLAVDPNAFIRPSPSAGTLGGVTRRTRETMLLCEAAGYDVVIVETVGIGQSETAVADMVDMFIVLMLPGAGDELQGIKKGVLEIADLVAINKADGDNVKRAMEAAAEYKAAFHIIAPAQGEWLPPVITVSGKENLELDTLWSEVLRHREFMRDAGAFGAKRKAQTVRWMWSMLDQQLRHLLNDHAAVQKRLPELERSVAAGEVTPVSAVAEIMSLLRSGAPDPR